MPSCEFVKANLPTANATQSLKHFIVNVSRQNFYHNLKFWKYFFFRMECQPFKWQNDIFKVLHKFRAPLWDRNYKYFALPIMAKNWHICGQYSGFKHIIIYFLTLIPNRAESRKIGWSRYRVEFFVAFRKQPNLIDHYLKLLTLTFARYISAVWPVWPDWAIYYTLGNFSKPLVTIIWWLFQPKMFDSVEPAA